EGDRRLQALDTGAVGGFPTAERPFPRRILGVNRQACPQCSSTTRWPDCVASPASSPRRSRHGRRSACCLPARSSSTRSKPSLGRPPRPPSSVPGGRPQQAYPQYPPDQRYPDQRYPDQRYPEQQQYPDQPYPGQARQAPPGGVQSQPLPPPDGAAAAVDPLPG